MLSLLLLLSQQMAMAHALTHLTAVLNSSQQQAGAEDTDSELSQALAQHQSCKQCLAFAQLIGPPCSASTAFGAPELVSVAAAMAITELRCLRTDCVFQPRAPPQA
jgi:hypothetical protein